MVSLPTTNAENEAAPTREINQDPRDHAFIQSFLSHLVTAGKISQQDSFRAMGAQRQSGERIDIVMTELGIVSSSDMLNILGSYCNIPIVDAEQFPAERLLDDVLTVEFLKRTSILPISDDGNSIALAISDPFARDTLQSIGFLTGRKVHAVLADRQVIDTAINRFEDDTAITAMEDGDGQFEAVSNADDLQRLKDIASEAPVIRYVTRIIRLAVNMKASDVHIEPLVTGARVRFRVDGVLQEIEMVPPELQAGVISRIKILARLNIAERRLPQDGRTKFIVSGHEIDLRVSTMPTLHGESTVLRILDPSQVALSFPDLGFEPEEIEALNRLLTEPNGIILITGPTGSGKTTTLYTALQLLNSIERKIFTVEDPIEYELPGLNQIQVLPAIGLDFAPALRTILRQDPDTIMIGEMRDLETASIGIQAALTGHLVLSTLHTNNAPASIIRLLDIGVEDYLLASALNAVAAQRLVRTLCPDCAEEDEEKLHKINDLNLLPKGLLQSESVHPRRPVGCAKCNHTGYRGRTTIFELLEIDNDIRNAIKNGKGETDIRNLAVEKGMKTLLQSGIKKVLKGQTTLEMVMQVTAQ